MNFAQVLVGRRRGTLISGCLSVALGGGLLAAQAVAEVGDGGDRNAVNLRVSVPSGAKLTSSVPLRVSAFSESAGPVRTPFAGTVTFAASSADVTRKPIMTKLISGIAAEQRTMRVRLSASDRTRLRRAAREAGRRSVVVSIKAIGQAPDRAEPSSTRGRYALRVR